MIDDYYSHDDGLGCALCSRHCGELVPIVQAICGTRNRPTIAACTARPANRRSWRSVSSAVKRLGLPS